MESLPGYDRWKLASPPEPKFCFDCHEETPDCCCPVDSERDEE